MIIKPINTIINVILFVGFAFSQRMIPIDFSLNNINFRLHKNELKSNIISEIKLHENSTIWLGTGQGLAMMQDSISVFAIDSLTIVEPDSIMLLTDGISAIGLFGSSLIVAGAGDDGETSIGTGLYFTENSLDSEISWIHFSQPMDNQTDTLADFSDKSFWALPVTVPNNNVTYDAAISDASTNDYIWIASWAGGLRRIGINDATGSNKVWTRVPLPLDDQDTLSTCDAISYDENNILKDFYLNPRDPWDSVSTYNSTPGLYGNHNHKAFSVLAFGDTVWVGTANGINRGLLGENGCIDWKHFSFPEDGISGNFVVGLARQVWGNIDILWAVTMNAENDDERGLSYTINNGITWKTTLLGERVYNVVAQGSLVFAASDNGLWKAEIDHPNDQPIWALFQPAKQAVSEGLHVFGTNEILTNTVYSVAVDNPVLWIGTEDGLARSTDLHGSDWQIFQAEYDPEKIYAYPNPYEGDGFIKFNTGSGISGNIFVYNFAMENVLHKSFDLFGSEYLVWNGKDENGRPVDNGVYFINLKYSEQQNLSPDDHWVKLIVVK